jgi:transcriptional regulator with XRE-family HTH domain
MSASGSAGSVGELLREWRGVHGMSQLDLALAAGVSSRHVSFIETGRSRPSRTMVLRLAETLDLPLRERNALLVAAGFAPLYRRSKLRAADLAPVRRALELVLRSHEPYPAFVLDATWNILLANRTHQRLLSMLLPDGVPVPEPVNVVRLVFDPEMLRPRVGNWELVAHVLGQRVRRQLRVPNLDPEQRRLFELLLSYPGVREAMARVTPPPDAAVVIPLRLELNGRWFSWFSTIATIGTPQDVTLEELRIESMFPADEETRRAALELATDESG